MPVILFVFPIEKKTPDEGDVERPKLKEIELLSDK